MKSINKEELHSIFNGIASKNEIDFNKLYNKYSRLVYAVAFSILKNKEDSEDIFFIITIAFSIIFVKHQQKAKKKVSK